MFSVAQVQNTHSKTRDSVSSSVAYLVDLFIDYEAK